MQGYESLALIVSAALGGKKKEPDPSTAPKTIDQLEAALNRSFS